MKLREQQLGGRSLYQDASTLRVLLGGMSVPAGGVSSAYYRIWLIHVDGSDPDDYDVDDTGLAAANAAASSGDDILIPPYASFTSNYTITAGVAFIGQSPYATKFTGQITLGAGSYIKDCGINRSGSSTGTNVGMVGPGSGKGYVISCAVIVDQNGAGNAIGLDMAAGDVDSRESYFYGDAASGTGYGIDGGAGDCNLSAGCWVRGTTARMNGSNIVAIDFSPFIQLHDSADVLTEVFSMTETGFGNALTAAGSGDIIKLPAGTIAGNHTIASGEEVIGTGVDNSILSGTITNNGILSHLQVTGTLTNNATLNYVIDPNGYTQATRRLGFDISPQAQIHSDNDSTHEHWRISSPTNYDSTLQLYNRNGVNYSGWAVMKARDTDNFEIHWDATAGVESITALKIKSDGEVLIGESETLIVEPTNGPTRVANGNIKIEGAAAQVIFIGTAGGGGEGIYYKASGGTNRSALIFPGSNIVAVVNRAINGTVEIRANTVTAGAGGEVTVAVFEDDKITSNVDLDVTGTVTASQGFNIVCYEDDVVCYEDDVVVY